MEDRIILDFDALNRVVSHLNATKRQLQNVYTELARLDFREENGAYMRIDTCKRSLESVNMTISGSTAKDRIRASQRVMSSLSSYTRTLESKLRDARALFQQTEKDVCGAINGNSTGDSEENTADDGKFPFSAIIRPEILWMLRLVTGVSSGSGEEDRSLFAKFLNNELKTSGSVLERSVSGEGDIWGIKSSGTLTGSVLYGEAGIKSKGSWKFKDENGNVDFKSFGFSTEAKATGAVAKGTAEGNIGYLHGKAEGSVITGSVSGEVKATLWDDGKFNPSLSVGAKATGSVLQGSADAGIGTDQYGIYGKASGDVLHAEAEANVGAGYIKDKNGNSAYGVSAKASAMASVAQGKVSGGITLFGVDIDIGVKGYAGAAGVEVGGAVTTSGAKMDLSGALGLGAGLEVNVDWSDATWVGDTADAVGDFVGDVGSTISDGVNFVGDVFGWW